MFLKMPGTYQSQHLMSTAQLTVAANALSSNGSERRYSCAAALRLPDLANGGILSSSCPQIPFPPSQIQSQHFGTFFNLDESHVLPSPFTVLKVRYKEV